MQQIKFIGFLFYRYYSKGPRSGIAYFSACLAISFLMFLNILLILTLLKVINNDKLIYLLPIPLYFLVSKIFKKSDVELLKEKYDYEWDKVFNANVWLIIYIIISIFSFFLLLL